MAKRQSRIETVKTRDCDRTFILFGKCNSGKSALGNLLLGPGYTSRFSTHPRPEPSGHTKKIESEDAEIDIGSIKSRFQVIDQPGCNDNFYAKFSNECFQLSRARINASFLIVINPNCDFFSKEDFNSIMKIAEVLTKDGYCVFPNAIIVFTHADILDGKLNKDNLEENLRETVREEDHGYIRYLLELVDQRYIFVNTLNHGGINRSNVLNQLFKLTRLKLNVHINENHTFKGTKLKSLLEENVDANTITENNPTYDVVYRFNKEFNTMKKHDIYSTEETVIHTLDKLSSISSGISAIVILINLQEEFDEELLAKITDLPHSYKLGAKSNEDFWNHACIVFKVRMDSKYFVRRQIDASPKLRNLDRMVGSRYTWVTDRSSGEECYERIGILVKEVTNANKWRSYTDSVIVREMEDKILESFAYEYSDEREDSPDDDKEELFIEGAMFCEPLVVRDVLLSINHRFWGTKYTGISTLVGEYIWKNLNADIARRFKKQYPNGKVPTGDFVDFCLEVLKPI